MNNNVKLEIEKEVDRLINQQESLKNVQEKLTKIQLEVDNLTKGIDRTLRRIELLGEKQPRMDQLPEPQSVVDSKQKYNDQLKAEKYDLVKKLITDRKPEMWSAIEQLLPVPYQGI